MKKNEPAYSEALAELEGIVGEIENEEVEVDRLLEKVKRASFLLRYCREKLRYTEEEVKKVLSEMGGEEENGKKKETPV